MMSRPATASCRIGIDVGGTFTDLVLVDRSSQRFTYYKEPSTPHDPSLAVERGVAAILQKAGRTADDLELIVHGTTLGLNTIIQRKGAKLALVVSKGNKDVFEIGRGRLPTTFDFRIAKEDPLIPRELVFEVDARILADGTIEQRPDDAELDRIAAAIREAGCTAVAIMLLNSYLHPELEDEVAERLNARLPGVLISRSANIWPEIREYERALIAALNAYVNPLLDAYLEGLRTRLASIGVGAPIYVTASNGGTVGLSAAKQRPVDTLLSGPASGVVAAALLSARSGLSCMITFDMGGTSSDMAVSSDGTPEFTTRTMVGDFPLMLPVVNVWAIGAGGGSMLWVDPQGVLKVGPQSAGADPGPVCYGRGGTVPTITDCYLALGILRADGFLGGQMKLDRAAALAALGKIARQLGFAEDADSVVRVADAAIRVATAKMATEIHKAFAQRGLDAREFVLVAFGGAGPTHAGFLAQEAQLERILVPLSPGTLCAFGATITDLKRDYVRTIRKKLSDDGTSDLLKIRAAQINDEAAEWLASEGSIVGDVSRSWNCDVRYSGQAQEITVPIPEEAIKQGNVDAIGEAYHQAHEQAYGFRNPESAIDFLALRCQVTSQMPAVELPRLAERDAPRPETSRPVFLGGQWTDATVIRRSDLCAGDQLLGPALVEQDDTTVIIPPAWRGSVNGDGIILVERI